MRKTAAAMVAEGCPFGGVLYGGLMKTPAGIKVIEFNARFGDPETEVVLPRMKSDIYDIFCAIADGREVGEIEWSEQAALGIVLASKGYPGDYEKGFRIKGADDAGTLVYHMGTVLEDGRLLTAGGRVMIVVGMGGDLAQAREKALEGVVKVKCDNLFHRNDIGLKAIDN